MGQGLMSLLGGANSMLADSSHNLSIKENSECYVKMVPDSFEGYGNLDEENGKDYSIALLHPLTSAPSNGLFHKNCNIRIGGLIKGSKLVLKKWFGNSFRGTIKPIANLEKEISEVERRLQGGNYAPDLPSMFVNLKFSKLRGSGPPALIELLAINVGMLNFLESEWDDKFRLIIECDCKLIVESLSMSVNPPISFYSLVSELMGTIRERGMSLRWIPRSADALAKSGIG
ncbi:hypothetical protein V6N13_083250 [Hibiscus sabdariffa]